MEKIQCILHKKTVSVLGINSQFGRIISLLLKQSNAIKSLSLYDDNNIEAACDVAAINTPCKVRAFQGKDQISCAIKNADVILIGDPCNYYCDSADIILEEGAARIVELGKVIAQSCTKAIVLVAANPINSLLPLLSQVLTFYNSYDCNKVLGVTSVDNIRANSILARHLKHNPRKVVLPVVGGNSSDTRVPIFSQARPHVKLSKKIIKRITDEIKNSDTAIFNDKKEMESINKAYATTRFIHSVLAALRGEPNIAEIAFTRSVLLPGTNYCALPFILGTNGIEYRFPLPELTHFEEQLICHAVVELYRDTKKGEKYFTMGEMKKEADLMECKEKGLIIDNLFKHYRSNRGLEKKSNLEYMLMTNKPCFEVPPKQTPAKHPVPAPIEPFEHCYEGCNPLELPELPIERRRSPPYATPCEEDETGTSSSETRKCQSVGNCNFRPCNFPFVAAPPQHISASTSPPCCYGVTTPQPNTSSVEGPSCNYTCMNEPELNQTHCRQEQHLMPYHDGKHITQSSELSHEDCLQNTQLTQLTQHSQLETSQTSLCQDKMSEKEMTDNAKVMYSNKSKGIQSASKTASTIITAKKVDHEQKNTLTKTKSKDSENSSSDPKSSSGSLIKFSKYNDQEDKKASCLKRDKSSTVNESENNKDNCPPLIHHPHTCLDEKGTIRKPATKLDPSLLLERRKDEKRAVEVKSTFEVDQPQLSTTVSNFKFIKLSSKTNLQSLPRKEKDKNKYDNIQLLNFKKMLGKIFSGTENEIKPEGIKELQHNEALKGQPKKSSHTLSTDRIQENNFLKYVSSQNHCNKEQKQHLTGDYTTHRSTREEEAHTCVTSQQYAPKCPPQYLFGEYVIHPYKEENLAFDNVKEVKSTSEAATVPIPRKSLKNPVVLKPRKNEMSQLKKVPNNLSSIKEISNTLNELPNKKELNISKFEPEIGSKIENSPTGEVKDTIKNEINNGRNLSILPLTSPNIGDPKYAASPTNYIRKRQLRNTACQLCRPKSKSDRTRGL